MVVHWQSKWFCSGPLPRVAARDCDCVKKNELAQPFKLMDHQREILRLAFAFDEHGRKPWDTILYSCVKSGKTTLTAL